MRLPQELRFYLRIFRVLGRAVSLLFISSALDSRFRLTTIFFFSGRKEKVAPLSVELMQSTCNSFGVDLKFLCS